MINVKKILSLDKVNIFLLVACSLLLIAEVNAHESRPVYIQVNETSTNEYIANWKIPTTVPEYALPVLMMPDTCDSTGEPLMVRYPEAYIGQQTYTCPDSLSGQTLQLVYPTVNPSVTSLFRIALLNGEQHTYIMPPEQSSWTVPEKENTWSVAKEYVLLGIKHIFEGMDHLLFVACLVFIARTGRRILITVTGFTIAHSLTLGLSTLRIVELPVPPVEAAIALSIIYLAHEISVNNRDSWTWRYPVVVSSSFGLLHGFGFAAVLRAIGLPQTELPAALLFFNLGVEAGQIIFVLVLAGILVAVRTIKVPIPAIIQENIQAQSVAVYVIGTIAGFWFIERVTGFWY